MSFIEAFSGLKKDEPTAMSNYLPLFLLSVPSKILHSCAVDIVMPLRMMSRTLSYHS